MPGLQSIVSAWVNVNRGHVEYFENNGLGVPLQQQGGSGGGTNVPSSPSRQQQGQLSPVGGTSQVSHQHQLQQQQPPQHLMGQAPPLVNGRNNHVSIDPRYSQPQPPSLPSSSSLSTYSLSKTSIPYTTPETNSLTAGASMGSPSRMALPSQRYPLHSHPQHQQMDQLLQYQQGGQQYLNQHPPNSLFNQPPSANNYRSTRRSQHYSGQQQQQIDSYAPTPQVGADAILGRRKSSNSDIARERRSSSQSLLSNHSGEMRGSMRSSLRSTQQAMTEHIQQEQYYKDDGLLVPPGSSTVTSSVSSAVDAGGGGLGVRAVSAPIAIADPVSVRRASRATTDSSSSVDMTFNNSNVQNVTGDSYLSNILGVPKRRISGNFATDDDGDGDAAITGTVPPNVSGGSLRKYARQRIRKSHSRTDLVREMALDKNFTRGNRRESSTTAATEANDASSVASGVTVPRRNSAFLSFLEGDEELDLSATNNFATGTSALDVPLNNRSSSAMKATFMSTDSTQMRQNMAMNQGWFPKPPTSRMSSLEQSSDGSSTVGAANTNNHNNYAKTGQSNLSPTNQIKPKSGNLGASLKAAQQLETISDCEKCSQLEATLLSLQADLEYLRTLDLQNEFVCKDCESGSCRPMQNGGPNQQPAPIAEKLSSGHSVSSAVSLGSRGSSRFPPKRRPSFGNSVTGVPRSLLPTTGSRTATFLRDASKRLSELSNRHKRQVKQTTHERAYWQNDMHLKLEKFAMMCKNLNEEAAQRSNEVKETKLALDKITAERNGLVSQVETLKARVALYEEESVEHSRLREKWEMDEVQKLDTNGKTAMERDEVVEDLSVRLDLALRTIENERRQQQQRRQIIFPTASRPSSATRSNSDISSAPSSPHHPRIPAAEPITSVEEFELIQKSKEVARKSQLSLRASLTQTSVREKAMQRRVEILEQELSETKLRSSALRDALDIGEIAGVDLKHSSSASSM